MRALWSVGLALVCVFGFLGSVATVQAGGGGGSRPPAVRFIVAPDDLPEILATSPGGRPPVLLAARSVLEKSHPGYVDGAVAVDVDEWAKFSLSTDGFTDLSGWAERIGALGIDENSTVIVYDDGELKFAAQVRFLLAHFGVRNASLLNGGYPALKPIIASGALAEHPNPAEPALVAFRPRIVSETIHLVDRDDVAAVLGDPNVLLVDVRTPAEFEGTLTLPGDARPGHISGAINLPVEDLLDPAAPNWLQDPAALRETFQAAGLDFQRRIIVYCHDGAKSSLGALALINAGYTRVSLYFDSYENWSQDPDLPVER